MILEWKESKGVSSFRKTNGYCAENIIHASKFNGVKDGDIKNTLVECIEKASGLLGENINDESLYLLFEWDTSHSTLTIAVTDSTKKNDSPQIITCSFTSLNTAIESADNDIHDIHDIHDISKDTSEENVNDYTDKVQYWITNYLTTCATFMQFSLVAAFHSGSRDECTLL
ncbi:MAG: hypothetical protein ACI93R_001394 [Flavobacteriales bacterium]|jgi:hypothetical protein